MVLRDGEDEVLDLSCKLWHQGGYHKLIHSPLYGDLVCGKLGLNLGKPYMRVCGPEGCLMLVAATVTGSPSAGGKRRMSFLMGHG